MSTNDINAKLNKEVELVDYIGGETNTATVNIIDNTITVDAKINVEKIETQYNELIAFYNSTKVYLDKIQKEINDYNIRFAAQDTKITELNNLVNELSIKVADLKNYIDTSIAANFAVLKTEIDKVKVELENTKLDINSKITQINAEISALNEKVNQITEEVIARVTIELNALKTKINALEIKVVENYTDLDKKILALDTLTSKKFEDINADLTKLDSKVDTTKSELTTKIDTLSTDVDTKIQATDIRITGLDSRVTSDIKRIDTNIDTLNTRVDNISTTILPLIEQKIKELADDINAKLAIIEENLANLETTLTTRVDNLEVQVTDKVAKLDFSKFKSVTEASLAKKGGGMYYDSTGELDPSGQAKSYWYMTSNNSQSDPTIIAGPYNFGTGGGGGGGGGGTSTKVTIYAIDWPVTVAYGTECKVKVEWSSYKEETPTGNGTIALYVNESLKLTQRNTKQGEVEIDVSEYLIEGSNTVEIRATDAYGTSDKVIQEISTVKISLDSRFDDNLVFTNTFPYTYIPYGKDLAKTVYFIIDGDEEHPYGTQVVTESGEQQTFNIGNLSHGSHTLTVYFKCTISGNEVISNTLFYDLMYEVEGNTDPIIVSTFTDLNQEQYTAFSIPYRVYTPDRTVSDVKLYIDGDLKSTLTVGQTTQKWETKPSEEGIFLYEIICGTTVKRFTITVAKSEIPSVPVPGAVLTLTTTGRSNSEPEEQRWVWEDTTNKIKCNLSDFNFVSDGWLKDDDDNTVLRVTGDARVEIPIKIFAQDFTRTGKTIEFEFASRTIRDYEALLVSCLDNADYFTRKAIPLDVTGRTKSFDIKSFDNNTFKEKVNKLIGTYTFIYNGTTWTLNSSVVTLSEYGIELKEVNIEPVPENDISEYIVKGDKITVKYTMEGRGFSITPQIALIRSQLSELSTQYKEDEHVRVTFVIESTSEFRIMYMYINGIMSGATQYPTNDSFNQVNPVTISIGSSDATIDIYNIRVYNFDLNRKQVVNNWIADTQSGSLKKERYLHNDNYNDSGEIVISKLPEDIPYIIWDMDVLPEYKGDKRPGNARFVDPTDSAKNFTALNAQYNVQGTSSSVYPVKNIRIKYKQGYYDDEKKKPWPTFEWYDDNANVIKKYSINSGIADSYFTYKVDYASSEGANNVELVRLYNDAAKSISILNPAQKLNSDVRVGIDGFPIVAFHRGEDGEDSFLTKANFNNDKANEAVYGFADGDESWEITNNSAAEANFKKPATKETFANAFEIRFPDEDGYSDLSKLGPMTTWVVSTDPEQATNNELSGIKLLESEPDDWNKWFTSYLQKTESGKYENIIKLGPVFEKNKYYWRVIEDEETRYFLLDEEPEDWRTNFENYFYKDGEIYKPVEGTIPAFELNKYYIGSKFTYTNVIRSEDGTYSSQTVSKGFAYDTADYRLAKFKAELKDWFDVDSTVFYYIFTLIYLMIDSRAKNAFPTYFASREEGDGGDRWFWLPYDMDTAIGINNEGKLVFDYNLEDTDTQEGANVFNGQDSVMWNNLREMFDGEIGQMYAALRTTDGLVSFANTEKQFEVHQSKWSESIFNEDSYIKYVKVLMEQGDNYLEMLQGSKAEQRKWWLYNRFKYMDSKYLAGDAKADFLQFRAYGKADITIIPYADIYATVSYANSANAVVSVRAERGKSYTLPNPLPSSASDQETYIYSVSQLKSIGDLSPFKPDTVKAANAVKLQELQIGADRVEQVAIPAIAKSAAGTVFDESLDYYLKSAEPGLEPPGYLVDAEYYQYTSVISPVESELATYYLMEEYGQDQVDYVNPNLKELTLGKNILLKKLDVRNCINLKQAVDISGCTNIEEVYFDGTAITGLLLPDGGVLKILHLPDTLRNLTIKNQKSLTDLQIAGTAYIQTLDLENIPVGLIDYTTIIKGMGAGHEVKLIGITQPFTETDATKAAAEISEFYALLDTMKHIDAKGELVDKAEATGNIYVENLYYKDYMLLKDRYPEVIINVEHLICEVIFYQYDDTSTVIFAKRFINAGNKVENPGVPVKESTAEFDYEFESWDFDFETIIQTDISIRPIYKNSRRKYLVHFDTQTERVKVPDQEVEYGKTATEPEMKDIPPGTSFDGWFISPQCLVWEQYDFDTPIIQEITLYGKWTDLNKPSITIAAVKATAFNFKLTDNLAVKAWAITETSDIPSEEQWHEINPPVAEYISETPYVIEHAGTYYVWAKDTYNKINDETYIKAYTINKDVAIGSELIITDATTTKVETNYVLQSMPITLQATFDFLHYEDLVLYKDTIPIENPSTIESIVADFNIKTTCNPQTFTVSFNMNGRGNQEPDQFIVYDHLVAKPENQYVYDSTEQQGYIVDEYDWYLEPEFINNWKFAEHKVDKNITLYAKWRRYQAPTVITVDIPTDNTQVICNFIQEVSDGFEIDWGDGTEIETAAVKGLKSIPHNYTTKGIKTINITATKEETIEPGKTKTYTNSLGINSLSHPVIEPAKVITSIKFAYNVQASNYALAYATNLIEAEISPYSSEISTGEFFGCTKLEKVNIPDSIWKINDSAFLNCSSLIQDNGKLTLGSNVTTIGDSVFSGCTKITQLDLADSIESIGMYAFSETSITEFIAPAKLTSLEQGILAATQLETLVVSNKIVKIGSGICTNCAKLNKVIFEGKTGNLYLPSGGNTFEGCKLLTSIGPIGSGASIEYAWEDYISATMFTNNKSIESVIMNDSMTVIKKDTFGGCSKLKSFVFSNNLQTIEFGAFMNCRALADIEFPVSLKEINERAFYNCERLTITSLPIDLTFIGKEAFYACFLTNSTDGLAIPHNVNYIGYKCFGHCYYLKRVDVWTRGWQPETPAEEGDGYWFENCTSLVDSENPKLHLLNTISTAEEAKIAFGNYWNYYAEGQTIPFVSDLQKE